MPCHWHTLRHIYGRLGAIIDIRGRDLILPGIEKWVGGRVRHRARHLGRRVDGRSWLAVAHTAVASRRAGLRGRCAAAVAEVRECDGVGVRVQLLCGAIALIVRRARHARHHACERVHREGRLEAARVGARGVARALGEHRLAVRRQHAARPPALEHARRARCGLRGLSQRRRRRRVRAVPDRRQRRRDRDVLRHAARRRHRRARGG